MPKKSCSFLYSDSLKKKRQDFVDSQYASMQVSGKQGGHYAVNFDICFVQIKLIILLDTKPNLQ